MRRGSMLAVVVVLGLGANVAAQPEGPPDNTGLAHLSWARLKGARRCVPPASLEKRVEDLTGIPVWARSGGAPVTVEGWIVARPAPAKGFVAGVAFLGPDQTVLERKMLRTRADNCRVLDEALARMIARTLAFLPAPGPTAARTEPAGDPAFNPYVGDRKAAADRPRRRRAPRGEPLPNPYAGHPNPEAVLEPYFNPYRGQLPTAVAEATPRHTPADVDSNPYYAAPAPPSAPGFNPYRP